MPKETKKQKFVKEVLSRLRTVFPTVKCALYHENALQLLVATILSAQCTDKRVNMVTPKLFKRFPGAEDFARADITELEMYVRSTGFYKNKAKNIKAAARKIVDDFGGKVPRKMEDLIKLPGVARKTANVVLAVWYGIMDGIVVDTHVTRISNLLGLTKSKNAVVIERELMKVVPEKDREYISLAFIEHGRKTCIARRPQCHNCVLNDTCPSAFLKKAGYKAPIPGRVVREKRK